MNNRIQISTQHKRQNGTIQETEVHIEIFEDGINMAATGTITFSSVIKLADKLKEIVSNLERDGKTL